MERNDFDKMLRDRLEGVTEPAPDVWEGISRGLARRHRRVLLRRFATGAVAAAAGLAVALLVFRGPQDSRQVEAPVRVAHSVQPSPEPEVPAPIATQIERFTKNRLTAQAVVNKPAVAEPAATETAVLQPAVTEPAATETPVAPAEEEPRGETPVQTNNPEERQQLTEDDLPEGFWQETPSSPETHTSHLSILSNLTTVASDKDLIYKASPMHSSSQTGNRAMSKVEPLSGTPRFFSPLSVGLQVTIPLSGSVSLSSGLTYSYLVSQYDMLIDKVRYEGAYNQLHYVGIPLSLSWHMVEIFSFGFYASAGGTVEKCISQRYVFASNTLHEKVGGLQWSVRVGLGAEYWFVPRMGLYFDPSLVYFFDNKQPLSIRTQQPLQARFEVGLRFRI